MFDLEPVQILQAKAASMTASAIALAPNLVVAAIVVLLTLLAAKGAVRGALRLLGRNRRESLRQATATLIRSVVWIIGVLVAATVLFPNLTPTNLIAGLGIGTIAVGLAFQDTFENFLAGVLILLREPMRIGDDIECEAIVGRVEHISVRDSYIRQRSGELVIVPNAFLFKNPVRVLTDRPQRRITLTVGVAYGEDVDAAREVIRQAVESCSTLAPGRAVEVYATQFGESSIDFLVRWWANSTPPEELASRDEVLAAVKRALDGAGIEIPFPYRTLTFADPLRLHPALTETSAAASR